MAYWMTCTSDKMFNKNFLAYMDMFLLVKYLAKDELSENILTRVYVCLSHDVASGSDITP